MINFSLLTTSDNENLQQVKCLIYLAVLLKIVSYNKCSCRLSSTLKFYKQQTYEWFYKPSYESSVCITRGPVYQLSHACIRMTLCSTVALTSSSRRPLREPINPVTYHSLQALKNQVLYLATIERIIKQTRTSCVLQLPSRTQPSKKMYL